MKTREKELVAYHEAGHVVVGILNGFHVKYSTIIPAQDKGPGHTKWVEKYDPSETDCSTAERVIFKLYAGELAEKVCAGRKIDRLFSEREPGVYVIEFSVMLSIEDYRKAENYTPCSKQSERGIDPYKRIYSATEKLLEKHKLVVRTIAEELLKKERLTGDEVHKIVEFTGAIQGGDNNEKESSINI